MLRVLALAGGLTGAFGASQFPEYSQQYMQRLGGAVDELSRQIDRYRDDAQELGLSLDTYLTRLASEGALAQTQSDNIRADMVRHARLTRALENLEGAGPFMRARLAAYMGDGEVARAALEHYKPAVPATMEGMTFAGTGFLAGWAGIALAFAFLKRLWFTARAVARPHTRGERRARARRA